MGRRNASLVAVAVALVLPSSALAGPGGAGSEGSGVEHLATVPAPGAVAANIKTVDGTDYMFVSALSGIYVYDITGRIAPQLVGALPMPHFQNEDVSIGGDRLLISTDGQTGSYLLVVDISDPSKPFIERGIKLESIGEGHTASCIDAECRWVWVAGDQLQTGITVLDLDRAPEYAGVADADTSSLFTDVFGFVPTPKSDVFVGDIVSTQERPVPEFATVTHDVHVDSEKVAWVAGGGGTIGFDVSNYGEPGTDPLDPPIAARTLMAAASDGDVFDSPLFTGQEPDPENAKDTVNDFIHHNAMRPRGGEIALITEEDLYNRRTTTSPGGCEVQGSFQTWRIEADGSMTNLDSWTTEFNELAAEQDQDPWNGDVVPTKGLCSAHYFDERDGLVAIGWYEQGVRILDTGNPADIRQVGYWLPPADSAFSVYWAPGGPEDVIYALSTKRGVDVLTVTADQDTRAAVAPATTTRQRPVGRAHPAFGWVCRIL